ncbi:MAG: hypothetical protein LBD09_01060 [Treponema sp.]|jgi:hypothetical protein|nr:hypothetical protein [Treponema sp.]
MMKKAPFRKGIVSPVAAIVLGVLCAPSLEAQPRAARDVVLVIDTSASMMGFYNEVGTFLSGPFLAENLAISDTLHIISFGAKPRLEIARRVAGPGDIETAGGRIWLLYPVEDSSDPASAIAYTEQYVRAIPGGRAKHVFVVSDDDLSAPVKAAGDRQSGAWTFIRASARMGTGGRSAVSPASGRETAGREAAAGTGTSGQGQAPGRSGREGTGNTGSAASGSGTPGADAGTSGGTGPAGASGAAGTGANPSRGDSATGDPAGVPAAANNPAAAGAPAVSGGSAPESGGESAAGVSGGTGPTGVSGAARNGESGGNRGSGRFPVPLPLLVAGGLLILLVLLAAIILKARGLHSSPHKVMASAGSAGTGAAGGNRTGDAARDAELLNSFASHQAAASLQGPPRRHHYRDDANQFLTNPPMLNLFVEEQNTAIGRRNVHALKKGSVYTVGGGASDFLIFLVPVPPRLGQLSFDGTNCTFTPLKPGYFPDIGSSPVEQCIGKTIRILSDKNYEVFFHFERYRDPLVMLNQLLHSIQVPAAPGQGE